jgi:hypothetical protein
MPAKPLMSWEGAPQFRWRKRVQGVPLAVSCKHLGLPKSKWTKEASYLAANDWLRKKLAEIQQIEPDVDPEREETLSTISRLIEWAAANAPDEVPGLQKVRAEFLSSRDHSPILNHDTVTSNLEVARLFGIHIPEDTDPEILDHFFGNRRIHQDRLKRHSKVGKQQTVGYLLDSFLAELKLTQRPQTHDEIHRYLKSIPADVWSLEAAATSIRAQTVNNHFRWLCSCSIGNDLHNKRLGFFRRFVKWLYEEEHIEAPPRNLKSKKHRKKSESGTVKRFTGVAEFVRSLSPDKKTWALLCLNCGMTAADLGSLFWSDPSVQLWQQQRVGRYTVRVTGILDSKVWQLTRRRSKTGKEKETPTVTYKLWDETIQALESLPLSRSGLVFLHSSGSPMYLADYDESANSVSGTVRVDKFGTAWGRKTEIPLSKFRSIAADELGKDVHFLGYRDYFLAHAVKKMGDRHYYGEHNDPFFEALLDLSRCTFSLALAIQA